MTSVNIIDDTSKTIQYQGFWFNSGTWAASDGETGTLSSTNDPNANFTFTFPTAAIGFRFYGIKRSQGALYGICVDCDPNNRIFKDVDAFDPTDNGKNPPTVLYSQNFSSPSVHVIIVRNQPDARGNPPGNSQLTLDRLELDIPSDSPNTSTVTVIQGPSIVSPAPTASTTTGGSGNANDTSSTQVPIGGIVGGAIGGLAAIAAVILLILWLRRRKKGTSSHIITATPLDAPEVHTTDRPQDPEMASGTVSSPPRSGWRAGYGGGAYEKGGRHHPQMSFSSNPSSTGITTTTTNAATLLSPISPAGAAASSASSSSAFSPSRSVNESSFPSASRRPREQDAGPVPRDLGYDDAETLPPEYGQLFRDRMSARSSQLGGQQIPRSPPPPLPEKNPERTPLTEDFDRR